MDQKVGGAPCVLAATADLVFDRRFALEIGAVAGGAVRSPDTPISENPTFPD